uniref:Uncharacterized protein n=1 Tax=Acrobeloides nanus TaxID=290746 RepID=A0A914CQ58_9BILA
MPYVYGHLVGFTAIPVILQLLLLPFCVESPKYSLIFKDNIEQAERDLKKLRGFDDNLLSHYIFLVFMGLIALFIFFTYNYVLETKGKTIEEIKRDL